MLKYSIIVTIYNLEKYLKECLDSILKQTYRNIELIVVDDGSQDNSLELSQKIAMQDDRLRVFGVAHSGVSAARNIGLQNASGDYVFFVDGDDFIEKDYVEKANKILKESEVDILITNHYYYYDNISGKKYDKEMFPVEKDIKNGDKYILDYILYNHYMLPGGVSFNIYNRIFLERHNCYFPENISWFEDLDFFLQVMMNKPSYEVVDIKYYYYRRNRGDSAVSTTTTKKILDKMSVIRRWCLYLEQSKPDRTKQLLRRWFAREYYLIFPFCMPWYSPNINYKVVAGKINDDKFIWGNYYPNLGKFVKRIGLKSTVIILKVKEYSKVILKIGV